METPFRIVLTGAALFAALAGAILFLRLLPLDVGATSWPGPDVALCLALAWVLRWPDRLPALVIAGVFLLEDLILMRPPGLWAAIVLMGTEAARLREGRWREHSFLVEWLRLSILIGAMMLAYRVAQVLTLLPVPALGLVILHYIATVAAYPFVVLGARLLFGLRRSIDGETGVWAR